MYQEYQKVGELRDHNDKMIFSLWLTTDLTSKPEVKSTGTGNQTDKSGPENETGQTQNSYNDPMTDPQKRYLFRLLADRGIEGEAAYKHLKETFGVNSLNQITKLDASRTIDRMLSE